MPKIPLTDRSTDSISGGQYKLVDPKPTVDAAVSEVKAEDQIFSDIFKLGQGFLDIKKKEEEKTYANNYDVFKTDVDTDVEAEYQKGRDAGQTPKEIREQRIKPYLEKAWDSFLEDNKLRFTKDRQQEWESKKREIEVDALVKEQEYDDARLTESEQATATNKANNGDYQTGSEIIYSSAHRDDEEKVDDVNTMLIDSFGERLNGADANTIDKIEQEIDNLKDITIPSSSTETINENGEKVTYTTDKRKHLISDEIKQDLKDLVNKARKNNYDNSYKPVFDDTRKAIQNGDFGSLRKNNKGEYINPIIKDLPKHMQESLEYTAKMERDDFNRNDRTAIRQISQTPEGKDAKIKSVLEINKMIMSLDKVDPKNIDDVHREIMNALTAMHPDKRKGQVYPKWFIYQQQKILNEKLSELYTNTYSKTPDARNSQYMKGIAEFNETFDELFADLPQTQYRNMANDVYTGFYEEFETELDKARTDGKNINTFIKTFIYDRLKPALEFQMIEDQRKAILGDELRRQLDLDDQAISDAQKAQAGDNVFTGGTPIENENKDVDTSVETGVDNYIKEIDKAGGDFEKSLLGRKITVGEYNQVSFNGEKTKIQKGDYFVGDDGYTYSALVDGARPNAFVRVKDGKPIMYKGKPISYRK